MWYSSDGEVEVGFKVFGQFNSIIRSPRVNFRLDTKNTLLTVSEEGGAGFTSRTSCTAVEMRRRNIPGIMGVLESTQVQIQEGDDPKTVQI